MPENSDEFKTRPVPLGNRQDQELAKRKTNAINARNNALEGKIEISGLLGTDIKSTQKIKLLDEIERLDILIQKCDRIISGN